MISYMEQMKQRHKKSIYNKHKFEYIKEEIAHAVDIEMKLLRFEFFSPSEAFDAEQYINSLGFTNIKTQMQSIGWHYIYVNLESVYE